MSKNRKQKKNNLLFLLFVIVSSGSILLFLRWLGGSFFSTRRSDCGFASISRPRMAIEVQRDITSSDSIDFSDKSRFISPPQASTSFSRPNTKRVLTIARKQLIPTVNHLGLKRSYPSPLHYIVEQHISLYTDGNINYRKRQNIVAGRFIVSFHLNQAAKEFQQDMLTQLNSAKEELEKTLKSFLADKLDLEKGKDLDKRIEEIRSQEDKEYSYKRAKQEVEYQTKVIVKAGKEGNQKEWEKAKAMVNRAKRIFREETQKKVPDFPLILDCDVPTRLDSDRARILLMEYRRIERAIQEVKGADMANFRTNGNGGLTGMALIRLTRSRPIIPIIERLDGVPLKEGDPNEIAAEAANRIATQSKNPEFMKKLEELVDLSGRKKAKRFVKNFPFSKGKRGTREFFDMKTPLDEMADKSTDYAKDRVKEYEFIDETAWVEPTTGLLQEERPHFVLIEDMELLMPHKRQPLPAEKKLFEIGKGWFLKLHRNEINEEKREFAVKQKTREFRQITKEIVQKRRDVKERKLSPEGRERLVKLEQTRRELQKDLEKLSRNKRSLELERELDKRNLELEKTGSMPVRAKPEKRRKQNRRKTI